MSKLVPVDKDYLVMCYALDIVVDALGSENALFKDAELLAHLIAYKDRLEHLMLRDVCSGYELYAVLPDAPSDV